MARYRVLSFLTAVLLVAALVSAAGGYVVILKSGHKIRCKEPLRIEGQIAVLTLATGTLASYPLQLEPSFFTQKILFRLVGDL